MEGRECERRRKGKIGKIGKKRRWKGESVKEEGNGKDKVEIEIRKRKVKSKRVIGK